MTSKVPESPVTTSTRCVPSYQKSAPVAEAGKFLPQVMMGAPGGPSFGRNRRSGFEEAYEVEGKEEKTMSKTKATKMSGDGRRYLIR